jgi:hypothetical protein
MLASLSIGGDATTDSNALSGQKAEQHAAKIAAQAIKVGSVVVLFRESGEQRHGILRTKYKGKWGYWSEGKVAEVKQAPVVRPGGKHGEDAELQVVDEKVFDVECDGVMHKGVPHDMLKQERTGTNKQQAANQQGSVGASKMQQKQQPIVI